VVFGGELPALDDDAWELYDTSTDWSQAHDLADQHPDRLKELQRLWLIEAVRYGVPPLDDRRIERFNPDIAGRPELVKANSQILYGGMGRLSENAVINLKNKSHSVTAEIVVPEDGGQEVIIAQGGAFAGWCIYLHGADGVRLRRRRPGQGRRGDALRRRRQGRRGPPRRPSP
jgi:hypothetical protein